MATQGFVQVPPDSTGKKIDTVVTTTAAQHRHVMVIGDPSTDAAVVPADATKGLRVDPSNVTSPVSLASVPTHGVTIGDGSDTAEGATTDTAVTGDNSGSVSAKLRGLSKILADVWDSVNHWLKVSIQNSSLAVTQSGNWTARVVGNAGANIDAATAASVPANAVYDGVRGTTALPTAVTDGQLVGAQADKFGRQVVILGGIRDIVTQSGIVTLTSTSETTLLAAVLGVFLDLTEFVACNTSATAVRIDIRDATAGTIRHTLYLPAGDTRGFVLQVPTPQSATNNNWTVQLSGAVTDVRCWAKAIQNK